MSQEIKMFFQEVMNIPVPLIFVIIIVSILISIILNYDKIKKVKTEIELSQDMWEDDIKKREILNYEEKVISRAGLLMDNTKLTYEQAVKIIEILEG